MSATGTSTSVLIAEPHQLFRDALRTLIERDGPFRVTVMVADGAQAVDRHARVGPDIAILRSDLPELNGVDATRCIVRDNPRAAVVLLAPDADAWTARAALDAGARACVLTTCPGDELMRALRTVANGSSYVCPRIVDHVVQARRAGLGAPHALDVPPPPEALTHKEPEVLQLIAEGKATKEIAQRLDVSVKTAETHRTNMMRKLGLHNVAGLTRYAIRHGLAAVEG